jgi:hypothetical protein
VFLSAHESHLQPIVVQKFDDVTFEKHNGDNLIVTSNSLCQTKCLVR